MTLSARRLLFAVQYVYVVFPDPEGQSAGPGKFIPAERLTHRSGGDVSAVFTRGDGDCRLIDDGEIFGVSDE